MIDVSLVKSCGKDDILPGLHRDDQTFMSEETAERMDVGVVLQIMALKVVIGLMHSSSRMAGPITTVHLLNAFLPPP